MMTDSRFHEPKHPTLRKRKALSLAKRLALLEIDAATGGEALGDACLDCGNRALRVRFWGQNELAGVPAITCCDACHATSPTVQFVERLQSLDPIENFE